MEISPYYLFGKHNRMHATKKIVLFLSPDNCWIRQTLGYYWSFKSAVHLVGNSKVRMRLWEGKTITKEGLAE
jgi:hypothetical protein